MLRGANKAFQTTVIFNLMIYDSSFLLFYVLILFDRVGILVTDVCLDYSLL